MIDHGATRRVPSGGRRLRLVNVAAGRSNIDGEGAANRMEEGFRTVLGAGAGSCNCCVATSGRIEVMSQHGRSTCTPDGHRCFRTAKVQNVPWTSSMREITGRVASSEQGGMMTALCCVEPHWACGAGTSGGIGHAAGGFRIAVGGTAGGRMPKSAKAGHPQSDRNKARA